MKYTICMVLILMVLWMPVQASEVPEELERALPEEAATLLEGLDSGGTDGFSEGCITDIFLIWRYPGEFHPRFHLR